jgi:hypothetical protein
MIIFNNKLRIENKKTKIEKIKYQILIEIAKHVSS